MSDETADVFQRVLTGAVRSWRSLLFVHVIYALLGVTLLAPLTALIVRILVSLSGDAVIADQQILGFLLTPVGLASLVIVAAVMITIVALELAAMMVIGFGELSGWHVPAWQAIVFSGKRVASLLTLAARIVSRSLIIAVPFLAVAGGVYRWLLTDYDINYYLAERPREFWVAAALISSLLVAMSVLLLRGLASWSLSLPLLLSQAGNSGTVLPLSERHTAGRRLRICGWWLLWGLIVLLLEGVTLVALHALGGLLVPSMSMSLGRVLTMLSLLLVVATFVSTVVAATAAATFALLSLVMFDRWVSHSRDTAMQIGAGAREQPLPQRARRLVARGIAAASVLALLAGYWLVNSVQVEDRIEIVAHRGAAGRAPENTLASVRAAIEDGTDWVEIDVQETADGEVVVVHDSDLMKLAGVNLKVWNGTFAQIRALDVGSWFNPRFANERVPTLAEVLAAARGRARVVIELKYYGHDRQLEQRVADIVEAAGMQDQVSIMSLDYRGVQKFRTLRPDLPAGVLMARGAGRMAELDVDFLAVSAGMVKRRLLRTAHAAGKRVYVWTINDPVQMSSMISLGVDALITDEPALARQVLEERAEMNFAERLLIQSADRFNWLHPRRTYRDVSP